MASLPYVSSTGNIQKALDSIKAAAVPDRVSQDFVKTILKIPGGSGDQMTTYLKKIGFTGTDGSPTDLYTRFRNPTTSGAAIAQAIKKAYAPLYVRNEYMHDLSDEELLGLIVEETGQPHDSNPVKLAFSSLKALKGNANFHASAEIVTPANEEKVKDGEAATKSPPPNTSVGGIGLNLGYTINLNLPATSDQEVFNAIFKSLKEHLLTVDDA